MRGIETLSIFEWPEYFPVTFQNIGFFMKKFKTSIHNGKDIIIIVDESQRKAFCSEIEAEAGRGGYKQPITTSSQYKVNFASIKDVYMYLGVRIHLAKRQEETLSYSYEYNRQAENFRGEPSYTGEELCDSRSDS